jgi:tol-pal system protein YbgF
LRPNAHFWLGESHFAMGSYTPAAEQFLAVFNNYPEDVKVPDALLKLGMSLERLGAQQQACATFTKLLTDYPRAPQIVLDTARTEQGLAGC